MSTFLRALRRDLTAEERVGHRKSPEAAREPRPPQRPAYARVLAGLAEHYAAPPR
ncbi:hypothetical protein ACWGVP_45400 [Embleya sp. NPDC055612]